MYDVFRAHMDVLWGFLVALGIVLVLTPGVGRVARVLGVVDEPGEARRMHLRAVPRLGGLGIFLGIFIPALAFLDLSGTYRGILLGAAVATAVGMADDFRGLPWLVKLGGQGAAAAIAIHFDVYIDRFSFPLLGVHELPYWLAVAATVVWIVGMMNVINLLDGMDGLAAGISAIAGATFAVLALSLGRPEAAVLSAIVAGACLGFLRHNFYPARIFMGDSGSHLLGFILATVAIQGALKTAATVALLFPLLVLAVPILDTSFVIAKRLKYGRPLHEPTPWHLYHRFRNIGFSQTRAALYFYAWGLVLAGAALATRFVPFRAHGEWHLWPTVLVALIAVTAFATSLYMVIVLEILKLRRLRAWVGHRRAVEDEEERRLRSA
ncbi:MAG TPA: MraY family glycosyltransferase [Gaiellaceae bacterium]|nr:MraY family glycosyltransferase [Gaiellaceae bacterium]